MNRLDKLGNIAPFYAPGLKFPYATYKGLGGTHIVVGILLMAAGVVHVALSELDRYILLVSGSAVLWSAPMAIATGVVGVMVSRRKFWEVRCFKWAFFMMNLFTALLYMVPTALLTGLLSFHYYGMNPMPPMENLLAGYVFPADDGRKAMVYIIVALAGFEFVTCVASLCVTACCSPLFRDDKVITRDPTYSLKVPNAVLDAVEEKPQLPPQPQFQPTQFQPALQRVPTIQLAPVTLPTVAPVTLPTVAPGYTYQQATTVPAFPATTLPALPAPGVYGSPYTVQQI